MTLIYSPSGTPGIGGYGPRGQIGPEWALIALPRSGKPCKTVRFGTGEKIHSVLTWFTQMTVESPSPKACQRPGLRGIFCPIV